MRLLQALTRILQDSSYGGLRISNWLRFHQNNMATSMKEILTCCMLPQNQAKVATLRLSLRKSQGVVWSNTFTSGLERTPPKMKLEWQLTNQLNWTIIWAGHQYNTEKCREMRAIGSRATSRMVLDISQEGLLLDSITLLRKVNPSYSESKVEDVPVSLKCRELTGSTLILATYSFWTQVKRCSSSG
uniref:Uncharacterized protein n=1 Tax=Cacopsylla melanoneura TaxID=428564 RepID=A0A8D9B3T0_9HEMI